MQRASATGLSWFLPPPNWQGVQHERPRLHGRRNGQSEGPLCLRGDRHAPSRQRGAGTAAQRSWRGDPRPRLDQRHPFEDAAAPPADVAGTGHR
ncbi:hypothetical protein OF001_U20357 [Pseudomonas sp. OF001]|nr:hypothetical protein OF001_U20357 [Pseudomonas sp. OF001]